MQRLLSPALAALLLTCSVIGTRAQPAELPTADLSPAEATPLTQAQRIDALVRYRNDWIAVTGSRLDACPEGQLKRVLSMYDRDEVSPAELTVPVDGLGADDQEAYAVAFTRLLIGYPSAYVWNKLARKSPAARAAVDSAAVSTCASALATSAPAIVYGVLSDRRPYRLTLDSCTLDEELLALGIRPGERVADIGAGFGIVSHLLAYAGVEVTPTELRTRRGVLDTLRAHMPSDVTANFHVRTGSRRWAGLTPNSYDAVLVRNTLHHLAKRELLVGQLRDALREDGRLLIVEPYTDRIPAWSSAEEYRAHCRKLETYAEQATLLRGLGLRLAREEETPDGWWLTEWRVGGGQK